MLPIKPLSVQLSPIIVTQRPRMHILRSTNMKKYNIENCQFLLDTIVICPTSYTSPSEKRQRTELSSSTPEMNSGLLEYSTGPRSEGPLISFLHAHICSSDHPYSYSLGLPPKNVSDSGLLDSEICLSVAFSTCLSVFSSAFGFFSTCSVSMGWLGTPWLASTCFSSAAGGS